MINLKRTIATTISCFLITSCVSSFEVLRQSEPDLTFKSAKAPEPLAKCILLGWQGHAETIFNYGETYMQPHYLDGYSVYSQGNFELADVIKDGKDGSATTVNFYHQGGTFQYRINQRVDAIKACL